MLFPDLPLYIGGHSMGAAMAHMCALDLRYNANMSQVHVYTYGSPRVGNTQFYDFFNASVEVRLPNLLGGYGVKCEWSQCRQAWIFMLGPHLLIALAAADRLPANRITCSCWL